MNIRGSLDALKIVIAFPEVVPEGGPFVGSFPYEALSGHPKRKAMNPKKWLTFGEGRMAEGVDFFDPRISHREAPD